MTGVFHILQSSTTGTSPSNGLVSYPGHSCVGDLTPLQRCSLAYSTGPTDGATISRNKNNCLLLDGWSVWLLTLCIRWSHENLDSSFFLFLPLFFEHLRLSGFQSLFVERNPIIRKTSYDFPSIQ